MQYFDWPFVRSESAGHRWQQLEEKMRMALVVAVDDLVVVVVDSEMKGLHRHEKLLKKIKLNCKIGKSVLLSYCFNGLTLKLLALSLHCNCSNNRNVHFKT